MAMRKVTDKERQIILEHPELVMFYDGSDKRRFAGGIRIIVIPAIIAALVPVPFFFTAFAEAHPNLIVILSLLWVIAVIYISVALIMRYSSVQEKRDDADFFAFIKRDNATESLYREL